MAKAKVEKRFWLILFVLGLLWLRSGVEKIQSGTFPAGLSKILTGFASRNPYPFFKDFLSSFAILHSVLLGNAVEFGELYVGVSLSLISLGVLMGLGLDKRFRLFLLLGLLGGALLNLTFWLASGYTSPSNDDLNLFLMILELISFFSLAV